jgi:hypothetical protein
MVTRGQPSARRASRVAVSGAIPSAGMPGPLSRPGEHQLVPHQHDTAPDVGRMLGELVRHAAAEIDHLGGEPVLGRGDGAHQRMAGRHRAVR